MGTVKISFRFPLQIPNFSETVRKEIEWDPKVGFKIPYPPGDVYYLLTCTTTVNSREFKSVYIPKRLSKYFFFMPKYAH